MGETGGHLVLSLPVAQDRTAKPGCLVKSSLILIREALILCSGLTNLEILDQLVKGTSRGSYKNLSPNLRR
jgi:hypothetical protein